MSSWFSVQPPPSNSSVPLPSSPAVPRSSNTPNTVNPVTSRYAPQEIFGPLTDEDTAWLAQSSGFVAETQTFYMTLSQGRVAMCQVIHSGIGLWYPQIQFTFRYFDPATNCHIWKSSNVSNFKPAPSVHSPGSSSPSPKVNYDRRSCKSDQFSILLDPAHPETYHINGKHDDDVELSFTVTRMPNVPGWKFGSDSRGGFTYFGLPRGTKPTPGPKPDSSASADGYMVHRFWPRCSLAGTISLGTERVSLEFGRAIFIHAIQGMRPNLLASRWNFCNFQSVPSGSDTDSDPGVSLTMMEFTTVAGAYYGPAQTITVGSIVVGDKLVAVVGSPDAQVLHHHPLTLDPDTGYHPPAAMEFKWKGPAIAPSAGEATAELKLDLKIDSGGQGYVTRGLIEKVDVMAHIPYLVKKLVAAVAGARPYIYTWVNKAEANVEVPSEGDGPKKIGVNGYMFNEATFISDV